MLMITINILLILINNTPLAQLVNFLLLERCRLECVVCIMQIYFAN